MSSTKRQLTGVDEFLDWRPLEFVDEIPEAFVCTTCGVMAASPKRILACCHVFCPACYEKIAGRERICPVDGGAFQREKVETLDSSRAGLRELRVLCPNSPRGCTFIGKVYKLQHHFLEECRLGEVQCPRCETEMPQGEAVDHYLGRCSGRSAAMSGGLRKSTSFDFGVVAATSAGPSRENSSSSSRGSSGSRRKKTHSGTKSSFVRTVSSAETASTAAAAKHPLVALLKYHDAGSSTRSGSGGSSRTPSHESSLIKTSSDAKSNRKKSSKSPKSTDTGVPKVPSQKDQFARKVDSGVNSAPPALSVASTGKQQPPVSAGASVVNSAPPALSIASASKQQSPSSTGACSTTPTAVKLTARSPRSCSPGSPRSKTAATAVPAGFAFAYLTAIEDAQSRLACGEEVVLRSDSFPMTDGSFRIHARLRRDKDGEVLASFALCVCGGTWQKIAEWSLSTATNLVLVHPWDQSRNVRLPLVPNPDSVPVPPGAHLGRWDFWSPTSELKLGDVKARGFLSSGSLCVAVEVE